MSILVEHVQIKIGTVEIIHDVSLVAQANRVTGLIGPNGSGKSTLLKAISRNLRTETGRISVGGQNIWTGYSAKQFSRRVAVLSQERDLGLAMTVEEVITAGRTPYLNVFGALRGKDRRVITDAACRTGVDGLMARKFGTLSGGEKQRVQLARALAQEPEIIVLDEPTNHLDVKSQFDILELVSDLGLTVLMAIHDLSLAARYCDQLYLLNAGRILAEGEPRDVLSRSNIQTGFRVDASFVGNIGDKEGSIVLFPLTGERRGRRNA